MSHSVFRDLDDDKSSGNSSKSGVADNNLIVFINKDGGVQVDPNALQDLIGKIFLINIFNDHRNSSVMIQLFANRHHFCNFPIKKNKSKTVYRLCCLLCILFR